MGLKNAPAENQLDPAWAWQPFEPSAQCPWDLKRAAYLYRRAGFGSSWARLQRAVKDGLPRTLDSLFSAGIDPEPAAGGELDKQMDELGQMMASRDDGRQLSAWWLYRMLYTDRPLLEKATLFWHGHFATSAAKVTKPSLMLDQNRLLRRYALGKFEPMVLGISRDPAMLIWLDSTTNRRIHPNENYAREVMELFCLGLGNYTEHDIKEVGRAFTGWEVVGDKFRFNPYQHDTASKTILGKTGNFNGEDAVRIILDQPAALRFIARKLIKFFVIDEPEPSDALIQPLADQLRENGFDVGPVVRRILSSNFFFSDHSIARKVRCPVEMGIGLLKALEARTDLAWLAQALDYLGQAVFFPPNVKGWDGGRAWISSATLLGRANLVQDLVLGGRANYPGPTLAAQCERDATTEPAAAVDRLLTLLVAAPIPADSREQLIQIVRRGGGPLDQRLARVVHGIATMPEFQLC